MSLICMCVHDTEENQRTELTAQTLTMLMNTVSDKHRVFIVDNGSCSETRELYQKVIDRTEWTLISNETNIGTSRAINRALQHRQSGEHFVKIDNDVIIYTNNWVEQMESAIGRDPKIGIVGLKRNDLIQTPWHEDDNYRSYPQMLPHEPGQDWLMVELTNDIIGTCTMFNSAMLDKVGYSWQPGLYGYEDVLMSHRSRYAGFYNCFLPHIKIDHLDNGAQSYQNWKHQHSGEHTAQMMQAFSKYNNGDIYEPFY